MIALFYRLGSVSSSVLLHGLFILILFFGGLSQVHKLKKNAPPLPVIEVDLSTVKIQKASSIPNLKEEVKKLEALEKKQDKKAAEKIKKEKSKPVKKEKVAPLEKPKEPVKKVEEKVEEVPEVARPGQAKKIEDGQHRSNTNTKMHDLSLSVQDALRVRLRQCWMIDPGRTYPKDMQIQVTAFLRKDGTVYRTMAPTPTDNISAYVISTATRAVEMCSPFDFLPDEHYEEWKEIEVTFSPSDKGIK